MTANDVMRIAEVLLLPPGLVVWVGLLVLALVRIRPRIFSHLFVLALLLTWLLSLPVVAERLLDGFQDDFHALPMLPPEADVIVVLGGGHLDRPPAGSEFGLRGMPTAAMQERLVYAAYLAHKYDLPVIVTEGRTRQERRDNRHAGADFLRDVLGVENVIVESRAGSTFENAKFTAKMLKHYRLPVLVTHYWHMARAVESFMYFGIKPLPAPTGWYEQPPMKGAYWRWLPQARALERSYTALHEWLGYHWYRWYRFSNGAPPAQHD